jgi:hypothetical protein
MRGPFQVTRAGFPGWAARCHPSHGCLPPGALDSLLGVAGLAAIPARIAGRRPAAAIIQSELA